MKAAIIKTLNEDLVILDDIQIPPLKRGQVLVKVMYAGVCHSQLMEARGMRGEDKYLPHMLGHEGVGIVEQIGEDVTKVTVGDKVVLGWIKGEGIDAGGSVYQSSIGSINAGAVTTFSDYTLVSENRIVKVPQTFDDKVAVLLGCALPTGAGIVLNQLQPQANSTVLVYGLGGIGLSALLALKYFNDITIVAMDIEAHKLNIAESFGAHYCFSATPEGIVEFKKQFPHGVDAVVEAAGSTKSIEIAFELIKRGGRCIFASHPPHGQKISLDPFELICGKKIEGSWGGGSVPDKDIPIIADIIVKHKLPVQTLLSNEYSLEQINDALNDLEQRQIVRALINLK
ncbi:alcohol dehydrogenase catalytic domain-containing protein [Catenovulum sp. 2E275]|uniref:alcohol dehydrogenase catalytic domain-containing protein n=1 Tax=Catenovulum sp. 2E275 TaxID=2980497 RepID=UPI0021D04952|nr:zinc-binding dehydrogenase [Catenovulum sp. 2E275]MCU4674730.1 alcohol dehydrogenase catalytic domain-containing protein [Catenovulum sp. 2E275]